MSIPDNAIAIIGIAGRFPGAADVEQFWRNMLGGVTSIERFTDAELEDSFPPDIRGSASFVRARPILPDVDRFDADFFGMLPREAALTDPQHRLLLECSWSAIEDAGYDTARFSGAIGVFASCSMNTYLLTHVLAERLDPDRFASDYQVGSYDTLLGGLPDTLATRISYKLNLRGPSMTVQSACSSSLLAVSQACQSLLLYQSDMALAGGVSVTFPQKRGYQHLDGGMVSPDGVCRPFDSDGAGTMFGDGVAMVVLKRLADAIEDGDHVYAIIRGSAVNNDGSDKVGLTAPSVRGQAEVIASALAASDVEASTIGYVECHGTATPLGDPIEFAGLVRGFGSTPVERPYCALGSAKANVGHLDVTAGVAGLIKTALALHHREIPPLANFHKPNRHIDPAGTPFFFPTTATAWPEGRTPRRAGVSSFGVGGTNVHVVLEEAPALARRPDAAPRRHVLPLSARNESALSAAAGALADHLDRHSEIALADVARTLQAGRRVFERRAAVACATREEAVAALRALPTPAGPEKAPLIFMFPGQGAQHPGMARVLYRDHPAFRAVLDEGIALATPIVGEGLHAQLLDPDAAGGTATLLAQPALFIFEYALARLWMGWGLKPDAMVGHSVGELVAACVAGVFSFEDGCRLVATRARIMQGMAPGGMLAVRLPEAELKAELGEALDLAAVNAPSISVAAGPLVEIEALNDRLTARGVACRLLAVSHAFHSRSLDPVLEEIERAVAGVRLADPKIPFASCVTGEWTIPEQATDAQYWARHGRAPVRFADALATVSRDGHAFLLEVGPGRTLSALAAQIVDRKTLRGIAASLEGDGPEDLCDPLAALWCAGFTPDWAATAATHGRRISLPTYRFQRARYWIEPSAKAALPAPPVFQEPPRTAMPDVPPTPLPPPGSSPSRNARLRTDIVAILEELSGATDIDPEVDFLALGFDSLLLGQVARALERKFKTKITFRQLLKDISSVALLAAHLDRLLPPDQAPPAAQPAAPMPPQVATAMPGGTPPSADSLSALVQTQLQAMNALFAEQLRAFQGSSPSSAQPVPARALTPLPVPADEGEARVRLYRPSAAKSPGALTNAQRDYVEELVGRLDRRMALSKSRTQQDRAVLADPRTAAGFRREWKELVYPVLASRAKGSKIWDIDGNEYVDLVNGYGQTMLGHSPDFVTAAIAAQLEEGFPIGPQTPLAGEVAALVSEMTGDERVTFCNTGSEAVMAAMRVARAVTGRERVVVFNNDYHGQFDEVLVKAGGGAAPRALPVAPGIPPESVANMTVLRYGDPQALEWIEANGDDIAAVMVEPVQSRHPALRPEDFLKKLRAITEDKGAALVFDEIVTGFRVHPGGMQAVFGIRADLATYGKVVGGGMPIGILAGKARFMDALDGGTWRYGDDSVPEVAPTFFAGTFVRHPLVLAAAKAVLLHLKAEGPALQERLAARMGGLVERINRDLERRGLSTRAEAYSSWFYINFSAEAPLAALFWPQMRLLGVHVQDGYPCFLTTAHTDADIAAIERAFRTSLDALEAAGILMAAGKAEAPAPTADSAPLTEPQLEILTAAQMSDEASCAFNESVSIAFEGEIDTDVLSGALNAVVARHQALRGRVGRDDERMHFAPSLLLPLEVRDLSREGDPKAALATLVAADARTPFDLWAGPLVRASLIRLAKERHVLLFTAHHIVCDGWSVNIILNDLATFYRTAHAAEPPTLPEAPRFSQYAEAQAGSKEAQASDLAYWSTVYADVPPLPELPTDRPRPAQRSYAGATWSTRFDAPLLASLKKTGAAHGATLFAMLFTALQAVMGRLSGASDIVMGVPVAGQSVDDEPDLVGHCVQTLPLRAPLAWEAPFGSHVRAVAQRLLDSFDHPKCTYGTLVRALRLPRAANRLPLTEIQFNLERMGDNLDFGGPTVEVVPNAKAAVNFDIFVNVIESAAGLRIDCDYNSDLYDEATIARWLAHYRRLLDAICDAPQTQVAALPLLSAEQECFVLDTVNDSAAPYPGESCIHDLFAAQAAKTPDAVACVDGAGSMTYAQLDRRSTRLARELLGLHHARRGRVAVAIERSRALPVALLGVMKSGHAYVPLDVHQPLERLRQIALAAEIDGIICEDERIRSIAPYLDQLDLDDGMTGRPLVRVPSDDPAYVLFTSGSTGAPKGVEVGHRALTNIICDIARRLDVTAADVAIGSSAITFDVAAAELYTPLIAGARLVVTEAEEVKAGFELVALAERAGATLMQATPTLWRMLLEAGFSSRPGLRMISVGEAISRDVVDRLIAGGGRLWNLYGPTETTLYSSGREMLPGETDVTIGKPLANNRLYVLDDRDQLAPPGAIGRLFIGGEGLAKGYFDRSDLTAQAFRTIALAGRAPQRLYWTGDLARLLPSGEFEMHGRVDQQVKLRGFRIELEEIESVLRTAPGVRDCAVLLRADPGRDPGLVAYVVVDNPRPAELSAHLASRLPDYMVPTRWVRLEALPVTPNGKIDRNALPPPAPAVPPIVAEKAAPVAAPPRSPLETRIAAVWANVIGLPDVGVDAPLFDLGADSLQVFRIAAHLDRDGIAVSARDLMKNPTVAALARGLEGRPDAPREAAPVKKGPSLGDFRRGARRHILTP
ncbi:MAG: amino acid adenylation domain-containing protein [Alphaproteobacteria bacterium]|nr:amino acid adenylation domain-containing protein [Alphaproteobacteria bacterium]